MGNVSKSKIIFRLILGVLIVALGIPGGHVLYKFYSNRSVVFEVKGDKFQIYRNGKWQDFLVKGVDMGSGKPGYFPGQMGITKEEYALWFKQIAAMNANVIRVYTILSPGFYQALFEYNMLTDKPLYLLQGIWVDDNDIEEFSDAFAPKLVSNFQEEIRLTIDVLHGRTVIKPSTGRASGSFRFNVAPYVMGYIMVEEMEPTFVVPTNQNNTTVLGFEGEYLYTEKASPYEAWLASMGNYAISYEQEKYGGRLKPMSWTNWPTTDPLEHLNEPNRTWEDAVSVDLEHIHPTEKLTAGIFASYHIYPHFPDFIRFQPEYVSFVDSKGKHNPYEAYLRDLKKHHTMPVLVAEFGVPTSRGISRMNHILGYNHGHNTEKEQGDANADMFDSIVNSGYAGGIVFSWQDEWFKKTWNTELFDIEDNRPYWSNYEVSEQSYGLLSYDPGDKYTICQTDGDISEWKGKTPVCGADGIELYAMSDERYIYLMLQDMKGDVEDQKYYIGADIVPSLGSNTYKKEGVNFSRNVDSIVVLNGKDNSTVLVEASEDVYYRYYSLLGEFFDRQPAFEVRNSGLFNPWLLMMCRPLFLPQTKEHIPMEFFDSGKLLHGNSSPSSPDYTNLADFFISPQNRAIEVRIPWMLFNAADPSTKMFVGDLYAHKTFDTNPAKVDGIYFEVHRAGNNNPSQPGYYTWHAWADSPTAHERLKESYFIMQKKFAEY